MRRGELYRVRHPTGDPRRARVFVIVSRDALIRSRFSAVICAPVMTQGEGLSTQVEVGPEEGLKHRSWVLCDALASVEKARLTNFVGSLSAAKVLQLNRALRVALDLER